MLSVVENHAEFPWRQDDPIMHRAVDHFASLLGCLHNDKDPCLIYSLIIFDHLWSCLIMFDQHLPARCKMSIAHTKIVIILQILHRKTFGQVSNRKARASQTLKSQLEDLLEDTWVGIGFKSLESYGAGTYKTCAQWWYIVNHCNILCFCQETSHLQSVQTFLNEELIHAGTKHTNSVFFLHIGQQSIRAEQVQDDPSKKHQGFQSTSSLVVGCRRIDFLWVAIGEMSEWLHILSPIFFCQNLRRRQSWRKSRKCTHRSSGRTRSHTNWSADELESQAVELELWALGNISIEQSCFNQDE